MYIYIDEIHRWMHGMSQNSRQENVGFENIIVRCLLGFAPALALILDFFLLFATRLEMKE